MSAVTDLEGRRHNPASLLGPTLLIALGVVLLLNTLGELRWSIWATILRLWPILLIAAGLQLLVGRRSRLSSLLIAAALLLVLAVAIWLAPSARVSGIPVVGTSIAQSRNQASRAEIEVDVGIASLQIDALSGSDDLLQGTLSESEQLAVLRSFDVRDGTAYFTLHAQPSDSFAWLSQIDQEIRWELRLSRDLPLALRVNTGVGMARLNLAALQITRLEINTGVGQTEVTLPRTGQIHATLEGGVGQSIISIPAGVAAQITVDNGLGHVVVDGAFARQADGTYQSPGYEQAKHRVRLTVNAGVGSVEIHQAAE